MEKYNDRMEKEQGMTYIPTRGMKHIPTKEETDQKFDKVTAVLNNLKGWSWDVIPQYKVEKEEAEVIIEALEHLRINVMLPKLPSVKV